MPGGGTDLVGYHPSNGTVWVGTNARCGGFAFSQAATVAPAADWRFASGNLTGEDVADLLGYHPSNGTLWIGGGTGSARADSTLEGYAWPQSAAPGETIAFMVSGEGSGDGRFFRHTANAAGVTSVLMGSTTFAPVTQPIGPTPWRSGTRCPGHVAAICLRSPPESPLVTGGALDRHLRHAFVAGREA